LGKIGDGRAIDVIDFAVADLNGDGFDDVVVARWVGTLFVNGPALSPLILLNDQSGSFFDGTSQLIAAPIPEFFVVREMIIEDFNGDGQLDIFFSNNGYEEIAPGNTGFDCEKNGLLLSGADGKLHDVSATHLPDLIDFSHGSSAADIDGDGDIDIWVNNLGCEVNVPSYLLLNDGTGKFTIVADTGVDDGFSAPPFVGRNDRLPDDFTQGAGAQFVDADRDGDQDLYVHVSDGVHRLLLNDGAGRFSSAPSTSLPALILPTLNDSIAIDLDLDGRQDLVLLEIPGFDPGYVLQVLINRPGSGFRDETGERLPVQVNQSNGSCCARLRVGDIDGDGRLDLMIKLFGDNFEPGTEVADFFLNKGCGIFERLSPSIFEKVGPVFIAVDSNRDGFVDFLSLEFRSDEAEFFLVVAAPQGPAVANPIECVRTTSLVAAVLPSSRSVQVGTAASAFATIINTGADTATGCGIAPVNSLSADFTFQTTDPATNAVTGAADTPADIAGSNGFQTYVLTFTPTAPISPIEVELGFECAGAEPANSTVGLNTLLLSASDDPVPDVVALAATLDNDGIVKLFSTGVFAVATVNIGVDGTITATADTGGAVIPVQISVCETNPASGACFAAPVDAATGVTTQLDAGETPTFGIFVSSNEVIAFDPAVNRIFVRFTDNGGVVRGATSVAVRTQ